MVGRRGVRGGIGERENGARECNGYGEKNKFAINRRGRPVDFREKNFIVMILLLPLVCIVRCDRGTTSRFATRSGSGEEGG